MIIAHPSLLLSIAQAGNSTSQKLLCSRYNVEGSKKLIGFYAAPRRAAPFFAPFTLTSFLTKYYPL